MKLIRVRIKASGQIADLVPHVAQAMLEGKTAELVEEKVESASIAGPTERAVAPGESKKPKIRTAR